MCGLACVARWDRAEVAEAVLDQMIRLVSHRGPDGTRRLIEGGVGLGFARLSLVAPENGDQPLSSPDGLATAIVNGEVYNHRALERSLRSGAPMRTGSDCEVLVHLYRERGLSFLDDVLGMFAVILLDRQRQRLILARDRFGIKPLYFHRSDRRIVVASEIKALFADPETPRSVDWSRALSHSLLSATPRMSAEDEFTPWFTDIETVQPGTIVEFDLRAGTRQVHRYWSFAPDSRSVPETDTGLVEEYLALLQESVGFCADADASIGLMLSGGIDSAAVAALATGSGLETFTVLSPSTIRGGDAEYAQLVAHELGLPNHQVVFTAEEYPSAEEWRDLVWLLESPMCGPEQYYKYQLHRYARSRFPELKGMLLGAASDEFNGGYSTEYSKGGDWLSFLEVLSQLQGAPADRERSWNQPLGHELLRPASTGQPDPFPAYLAWEYRKIHQYNVWHEDRTAAGNGIEARVPFLDHRLVELVTSIPAARRPGLLYDKQVLRRGLRGRLPDSVVNRPKVPFYYSPDGVGASHRSFLRMLAANDGELLDQAFSQPQARQYLDLDAGRRLLAQLAANPGRGQLELLLRLVNLGLLEAMTAELPGPVAARPTVLADRCTFEIADWPAQLEELNRVVLGRRPLQVEDRIIMSDNVNLVQDLHTDNCYLVRDGAIEYELTDPVTDALTAVLAALDGERTIADCLDKVGAEAGLVLPMLADAVDEGLLRRSDSETVR